MSLFWPLKKNENLKILTLEIFRFSGLTFRKDLYLASAQIYPPDPALKKPMTRLQVTTHFHQS